jgi:hypothetical protein
MPQHFSSIIIDNTATIPETVKKSDCVGHICYLELKLVLKHLKIDAYSLIISLDKKIIYM